ncbi:MAG: hypothetical protein HQK83_20250, partial [Fibrobacteria bacterium]|nr:hypothetical protein [Fibrobacteria bacterium]
SRNIEIERSSKANRNTEVAVISSFSLRPTNHVWIYPGYKKELKLSVNNAVYNSGKFKDVKYGDNFEESDVANATYLDITIIPSITSRINWFLSWPAVYPCVFYWPLQPKSGEATVTINAGLTKGNTSVLDLQIKKSTPFNFMFYGFFRTAPDETALQQSYDKALDELTDKLRDADFGNTGMMPVYTRIADTGLVNIAVIDFESEIISPPEARALTNKLRGELIMTGRFQVMERNQMDEIMKEQGIQLTGCTSTECVIEIGQLIGVNKLIAGDIGKVGSVYLVSLRLIDVESGTILSLINTEIDGTIKEVLKEGIRNAARQIAGM